MSRIMSWLERWRAYGDWLMAERRWLDEHMAKLRLLTDEQLSAFPECWRCNGNGYCGGGIRKELCHACWGKGFLDGSEDRQSALHHEKPIRPRTRRGNIGAACALALLLCACGTAPQYQIGVYYDGIGCFETRECPPIFECTVSPTFDFDCPTFSSDSITDSVEIDVANREVRITGHGCADRYLGEGFCDSYAASVRFADDGSFSGHAVLDEFGISYLIYGELT